MRPVCFIDEVDKPYHTQRKNEPMLITLEDLEDNEHNRRYGREIVRKSFNSQYNQLWHKLNWIATNDEWTPFVTTVVFKNLVAVEARNGMRKAARYHYEHRALRKIKKRLCRSSSNWKYLMPYDELFVYEYEQGSFFKPVPKDNAPHHIHGLFPVRKEVASRIYDFQTCQLDERLTKDIASIDTVSSFKIEPLNLETSVAWLAYMLKEKTAQDLDDI